MSTRRTALVLFFAVLAAYQFPLVYDLAYKPFFVWAPGIDIASTSLLPVSLLQRGDFTLDQFGDFASKNYVDPYFLAHVDGRTVSRYPVIGAVLALPFYGIPMATGWLATPGYSWLQYPWTAFIVARLAAATMAALAALVFFFCARELTDRKTSLILAGVFALGTSMWSTVSIGMWQQTPSILLQLIGIWFILRGRRQGAIAVAPGGFFLSAATVARQNNIFPAIVFTVYVLVEYRAALGRWISWALPPALLAVVYNTVYNGSPLVFGYQEGLAQTMGFPRLDGVIGLFLSPSRGLLIYSPFLILALVQVRRLADPRDRRFYLFALITFVLGVLFLSTFRLWDGGWGYGTRLVMDVLPYGMFLLVPVLTTIQGWMRVVFWAMAGYAVAVQFLGLWDYGERWHWQWENLKYDVWDIGRSEILFYLREYAAMAQHYATIYLFR